ncbi:hypothetical protein [Burkholderia alba]|uniref:hypothetical protein n=1 Tax=Burkholderia alba TaxID=2683677 RepID=UPI002B059D90|nr:hypothetical protein [Burkholderia alba]
MKQYVQATLPRRRLIHFDPKQRLAGPLVLAGLIGIEKGLRFIFMLGKSGRRIPPDSGNAFKALPEILAIFNFPSTTSDRGSGLARDFSPNDFRART